MNKFTNSFIGLFAMLAFVFCVSVNSNAQTTNFKNGQKVTVQGEVLDMNCYMVNTDNVGEGHAQCAKMCVQGGGTMGVLDAKGNVFLMVENHSSADAYNKLKNYGAETVNVSGIFYNRGGVNGIVVQGVEPVKGR